MKDPKESSIKSSVYSSQVKPSQTSTGFFELSKIKPFFLKNNKHPTFCGHLLITGVSIVLIVTSFSILKIYADIKSKDWTNNGALPEYSKAITEKSLEQKRLKTQFEEIQQRIRIHQDVMLFFYQQYFISISMTSGLAIVAGICVFFIAQSGWKSSNPALINIFIVTTSAGLLYQRLPEIFKQDINLQANGGLYLKYTELNNELMSYFATQSAKSIAPDTYGQLIELEPKQFIHYIDNKLAELNQIPIEFDATKVIKLDDLQDTLNIKPETPTLKKEPVDPQRKLN